MVTNSSLQNPNTQRTSHQGGMFGLQTSKAAAALLAAIFCVTFYVFQSNTLSGDGLRHLIALRTITQGVTPTFEPKPWLEVYRHHYDDMVVHNHFLFGATMRAAFALQQKLRIPGDAVVAMHAVNALSAAVAGALFFLLALRVGVPRWISLAVTLGLCFSPAYLFAATNIAEPALSLPFFVGTLLLLSDRPFVGWTPVAAGILAGLAAITYFFAGSLVAGIAAAVIATRFPSRSATKALVVFLAAFGTVFLGIWVAVLVASGFRTPNRLLAAILHFPQHGTYGGFKFGSFIATPVGLTEAFTPVLPDDFQGLRSLTPLAALYVGAATLIVCTFLATVFYFLFKRGMLRNLLVLSCLLTFLIIEAACLEWEVYYQKLHLFGLILCWVMVAAAFSRRQTLGDRWSLLLFVPIVVTSGLWVLKNNVQPSQQRTNAEQLISIVGTGVLITTWSADVMHTLLYSDGVNFVSLPDFAFAHNLNSKSVQEDLEALIQQTTAHGGNVYLYGLFDEKAGSPSDIYETRFRLTGFTDYLRSLQRKARPVARLPQPGGHSALLYIYGP
jgi:hypothetical protein